MFDLSSIDMKKMAKEFVDSIREKEEVLKKYINEEFNQKKEVLLKILEKHKVLSNDDYLYGDNLEKTVEEGCITEEDFAVFVDALSRKAMEANIYAIDNSSPISKDDHSSFYFSWFIVDGIKCHSLFGQGTMINLTIATNEEIELFNKGNDILNDYFDKLSVGDEVIYKSNFNSAFDFLGCFKNKSSYKVININKEDKEFDILNPENNEEATIDVNKVFIKD